MQVCLNRQNRLEFEDTSFIYIFLEESKKEIVEIGDWNAAEIKNSADFWIQVLNYGDAGGNHVFQDLADFAITLLNLPSSNAVAERVFFIMNAVKTKARNILQLRMLSAVLRLTTEFYSESICCNTFKPSLKMYRRLNYNIYKSDDELETGVEEIMAVMDYDVQCI
ncbi:hypothetical protein ILUMI_24278 [Ignelater luminosus]|uniref:HAT C-terminal dimerisation domain-containing protein n=1 Tax=Ignelater luminosus TaxID=2038154 RepID=A0A8K0CAV5_IGNLU|nr:hypothetical protein ILUMI_24278 [Ignelater luminosus]